MPPSAALAAQDPPSPGSEAAVPAADSSQRAFTIRDSRSGLFGIEFAGLDGQKDRPREEDERLRARHERGELLKVRSGMLV